MVMYLDSTHEVDFHWLNKKIEHVGRKIVIIRILSKLLLKNKDMYPIK
jgi:hypothetical protein